MKKIAIIGAGPFGSEIAIQLGKIGHPVTLFEKENDILSGDGTPNSVMRLHMGFHYPRSVATAKQSKIGFNKFLNRFPESVDLGFSNFYAISKHNSRSTPREFEDFTKKAGIHAEEVSIKSLQDLGVDTSRVSQAYRANEGVICVHTLRELIRSDISKSQVELRLGETIVRLEKKGTAWTLHGLNESQLGTFDFVVIATYSNDTIEIENSRKLRDELEHHKTITLEINAGLDKFGLTVIDGDFLTLMPVAFEGNHLVYAPIPSVITKSHGANFGTGFYGDIREKQIVSGKANVLKRLEEWFPSLEGVQVKRTLIGSRSIEPNLTATDQRLSAVKYLSQGLVEVSSGKIDHCVALAEEIAMNFD